MNNQRFLNKLPTIAGTVVIATGFAAIDITLFGPLFSGVLFLFSLFLFRDFRPYLSIALGVVITMLVVVGVFQHARAKRTGNSIVSCLQMYNSDNGEFPENLDLLVPEYLPKIPRTGMGFTGGTHYRYYRSPDSGEFFLHFLSFMGSRWHFASRFNSWKID